ncbi:MAG: hypothetical protein ACOCRN_05080 [Spirochaetia bacterium]
MQKPPWDGLPERKQRRNELQSRMEQLDKNQGNVSQDTVEQLREKYQSELAELNSAIETAEQQIRTEIAELQLKYSSAEEKLESDKTRLSELQTLGESGAIDAASQKQQTREVQADIARTQKQMQKLDGLRTRLEAYLNAEQPVKGGAPPAAADIEAGGSGVSPQQIVERVTDTLGPRNAVIAAAAAGVVVLVLVLALAGVFSPGPAEDQLFTFADGEIPEAFEMAGDADWDVAESEDFSDSYAVRSGDITHNEESTMRYRGTVPDHSVLERVRFNRRVSSESGWDYLEFAVNGEEKDRWSGNENWSEISFNLGLEAGEEYELEWKYGKDGSVSSNEDSAWVDDIQLNYGEPE